jgi:hypothetical protein
MKKAKGEKERKKNKQKGSEHFHKLLNLGTCRLTWTATQACFPTAFRTGDPTGTVLGQIPGPSPSTLTKSLMFIL